MGLWLYEINNFKGASTKFNVQLIATADEPT